MSLLNSGKMIAQDAEDGTNYGDAGYRLNVGLIGCGYQGRDILAEFATIKAVNVVALCETYGAYLRRAGRSAPEAVKYEDYKDLLADENVQAVVVATPTHLHKDIVLDALAAGKHIYCEAPIAHTIEDARIICQAAKEHPQIHFQVGLQNRADPQRQFVLNFIRTGVLGENAMGRGQWNKKWSLRRTSPNTEREKELNWRLDKSISLGLVGELGIHQLDAATWLFNSRPESVTGLGSLIYWKDGRTVPDTIQCILNYPDGVRYNYSSTLCNSFDGDYEVYFGTYAAVMMRENRAWMFKEVDSPLLGWEVYARKDEFFKETGIALSADATKLKAQGENREMDVAAQAPSFLQFALQAFAINSISHGMAVADFASIYDISDREALDTYLSEINKNKLAYANYKDGYEATVVAIKAHEAVMKDGTVVISPDLYEIG